MPSAADPLALFIHLPADPAPLWREIETHRTRWENHHFTCGFVTGTVNASSLDHLLEVFPVLREAPLTLELSSPPPVLPDLPGLRLSLHGAWTETEIRNLAAQTPNINLDIGYGPLPSKEMLQHLQHISLYEDGQFSPARYNEIADALKASGFQPYDLYHFTRPGFESVYQRHLLAYGLYLGFGPGATSRVLHNGQLYSLENYGDEKTWARAVARQGHGVQHMCHLTDTEQLQEKVALALTTPHGVPLKWLAAVPVSKLEKLAAENLVELEPDRIRLTPHSRFQSLSVADYLIN